MTRFLTILFSLALSSCAISNEKLADHAVNLKNHEKFGVCFGYGCKYYQKTGLTHTEWQAVKNIFSPQAVNPQAERSMIAKAVALIEQYIGPKTGTDNDKARAIVINFSTKSQMDCIDEAFNSTTYLYLLNQAGLIKHHTLGAHLRRNFGNLTYPHSTATIHEIGGEKIVEGEGHFVVDSWFHENGALAEIIPAKLWMGRWYPKKKRKRYNFSASKSVKSHSSELLS